TMSLFACMFCAEQDPLGCWTGYPVKHFYRSFNILHGVITDSHSLAEDLVKNYVIPEAWRERITVLEAPVDASIPLAGEPQGRTRRPLRVYWAGRFDRQKRVDIVFALARRMRDVEFHLWGEPVLDGALGIADKPENCILEGVYDRFESMPLDDCDIWLYTSEWDGVPGILLEVAMTGIPIVGSSVGGTSEVLRGGMSWPIVDWENVDAYAAAITEVANDPKAAREKAGSLRAWLIERRTPAAYRQTILNFIAQGRGNEC
ncbi:MAG: glycosyltransferase family 4 protein, partial [Pseudomonadota bacterium]